MSNKTDEEEQEDTQTSSTQKRNATTENQDSTNAPKLERRIPKRQKLLEDDPVVVQARKALEMFQQMEAAENLKKTEMTTLGSPRYPKIHHRIPIISQQEDLLL